MTGIRPRCSTSLGKSASPRLLARSFSMRFWIRFRTAGTSIPGSSSAPREWYQSSSVFSSLYSAIDSR